MCEVEQSEEVFFFKIGSRMEKKKKMKACPVIRPNPIESLRVLLIGILTKK